MAEGRVRVEVEFASGLVVGPDDFLVLNLGANPPAALVHAARMQLTDILPAHLQDRFIVIGVEGMSVVRPEKSDEQRRERLADDLRVLHKRGYTRP